MLIYFARGSFPWEDLGKESNGFITQVCRNLPTEFRTYFQYIYDLEFTNQPNYSHLRELFRELFKREGFQYDNVFDWTIKKFFLDKHNIRQAQNTMVQRVTASGSRRRRWRMRRGKRADASRRSAAESEDVAMPSVAESEDMAMPSVPGE